jgi:CubicO group peptidase (beta-lactamase class C family)
MRKLALLLLLISFSVWSKPLYDFMAVNTAMQEMLSQNTLVGASVRNGQNGRTTYLQHYGSYTSNTRIPIASASKWLSALVLARLVEKGQLEWTDTVGEWIPTASADKRGISIEQLFSHTSGITPSDLGCLNNRSLTLDACAQQILAQPLLYTPGRGFAYGGNSMQVAARIAEIASGKDWNQLFYDELVLPLGMFDTDFATLSSSPGYVWVSNPQVAGGVRSTINDYARVVDMVLAYGKHSGQYYLQPSTLAYMRGNQMAGKIIISTPASEGEVQGYGIGLWIEKADINGNASRISSPGAFGTTPWVDFDCGCNGVIFVRDQRPQLKDELYLIETLSIDAMMFKRYIKSPIQKLPAIQSKQPPIPKDKHYSRPLRSNPLI